MSVIAGFDHCATNGKGSEFPVSEYSQIPKHYRTMLRK
jgi:hypothetical protein